MNSRILFACRNAFQKRAFSQSTALRQNVAGTAIPQEPLTIPPPEGADSPVSPKIERLVSDISTLTLLEVSELSKVLKKRLNLPDTPLMAHGFAATAAPKAEEEEVEAAAPKSVKVDFTVKLTQYDDKQKVALIKEVKSLMEGFNLVQAKKFVESIPVVVKENISKEEADKLKESLSKVGAVVDIV